MKGKRLGRTIEIDESYFGGKARKANRGVESEANLLTVALKR